MWCVTVRCLQRHESAREGSGMDGEVEQKYGVPHGPAPPAPLIPPPATPRAQGGALPCGLLPLTPPTLKGSSPCHYDMPPWSASPFLPFPCVPGRGAGPLLPSPVMKLPPFPCTPPIPSIRTLSLHPYPLHPHPPATHAHLTGLRSSVHTSRPSSHTVQGHQSVRTRRWSVLLQ